MIALPDEISCHSDQQEYGRCIIKRQPAESSEKIRVDPSEFSVEADF